MSAPISRRRALVLGGAGVVAVVAGTTGWIATADNGPGPPGNGSGAAETGAELGAPPLLDSSEGRLQIELVAAPGVRLAGRDTRALGFNGTSPGPTLRVRPGDELAVRLTNRLDQPTNLHTHGLRVSPQGNSDNPFLRVDPGTSFDYLIRVPTDHPPGTHWYHPHHHGTVADQVSGGLAGALIVDGGPALPVAADRVLLDQRHHPRHHRHPGPREPDGAHAGPRGCAGAGQRPTPARHPRRPPGDAAVADRQHLRGPGAVATTGGAPARADRPRRHLPARACPPRSPRPAPRQPRGRARHPDRDRPVRPRHRPLRPRHHGRHEGRNRAAAPPPPDPSPLATLVSSGAPAPTPALPAALPAEPAPPPATAERTITFQMGMGRHGRHGGGMGMAFTIDGRRFDPARTDQHVTAGTTEEWTVRNNGPLAHPFHLHAWPFTVLATSDAAPVSGVPQDVVLVPPAGWARIRIPFTHQTGRTVYHCHILDHEDLGMMATIDVQ